MALDLVGVRSSGQGNGTFGVSMMVAGTAVAALYVVPSSRIAAEGDPMLIIACQQTVAVMLVLCALPFPNDEVAGASPWPDTAELWLLVLASGLIQHALGFSPAQARTRGAGR